MMLSCFLRWRLVGLFLPFMRFLASFWSCCSFLEAAFAERASSFLSSATSLGSLRTYMPRRYA